MEEAEKKEVPEDSESKELAPDIEEKKPSSFLSSLKKVVAHTVESGKEASSLSAEIYEKSELKGKIDKASQETKQFLDERGITEQAIKAYGATQEHLDKVSGAKILAIVEGRLALQEKYNNLLATKLHEALQRIESLEEQLSRLKLK